VSWITAPEVFRRLFCARYPEYAEAAAAITLEWFINLDPQNARQKAAWATAEELCLHVHDGRVEVLRDRDTFGLMHVFDRHILCNLADVEMLIPSSAQRATPAESSEPEMPPGGEIPATLSRPPTGGRDSAPKQASLDAYTKHQRATKARSGFWASREQDEEWAKANNYAGRHIRDELRPQFKETLSPAERTAFEKRGRR
jgi:hypothetical protein